MATQKSFKKYAREQRIQHVDENYSKGMLFSNNPLQNTFCKELVNMDMADMGESLTPRPGLRTYELTQRKVSEVSLPLDLEIQDGAQITLPEEATTLKHIILGKKTAVDEAPITGTRVFAGNLYALTSKYSETTKQATIIGDRSIDIVPTAYVDSDLLDITDLNLGDENETPNAVAIYNKPNTSQIHNMPLQNSELLAQNVGTFAFNHNYYYFAVSKTEVEGSTSINKFRLMQSKYNSEDEKFKAEVVPFYQENPAEAVANGYNMLRHNPYTFVDETATGVSVLFYGIIPYADEAQTKINTTPSKGQKLYLRCYYKCGSGASASEFKFKVVWEWQAEGSSDWTVFKTETNLTRTSAGAVPALKAELNCPGDNIRIRVTAYDSVTSEEPILYRLVGVYAFNKKNYGDMYNAELVNYSLQYSQGMTYWKNRLICYGVPEDRSMLFMSEVNNPGYFPYPQNTDIFDEPIISVVPLLDNLLIFTTTQLYMLTLSEDGVSWTKKCIQRHLNISEQDAHLICPVKNMVFFKSGNYYYMVVPKLNSMTGELVIAPISKNIELYLDNFSENVYNTVDMLYNYNRGLTLVHHYNYLDFEDICNVYVLKPNEPYNQMYINFCLLYNSVSRNWRVYVYESQTLVKPFVQDATRRGKLISLSTINYTTEIACPALQYLRFDKQDLEDYYLPNNVSFEWDAELQLFGVGYSDYADAPINFMLAYGDRLNKGTFNNYQLLDTGYREQESDLKKRYREIQFKINNLSQTTLYFYTEVCIDGDLRKEMYRYEVESIYNDVSGRYELTYNKTLVDLSQTPFMLGATMLGETDEDINVWQLDTSQFPDVMQWKVRLPISGKGYAPKVLLISKNLKMFELLSNSFVYRLLNSR